MSSHRILELVSSAGFEPRSEQADRFALSRARAGDGTVLVVPTAIAPEGGEIFDRTGRKGVDHFTGMGVIARVLPFRTRQDAFREDLAAEPRSVSMIFLAGGHPAYLAGTLAGTPFWSEVLNAVDRGVALAGCSAGVWVLGELAPDSTATDLATHTYEPGLRLLPGIVLAPHWDALDSFIPGLQAQVVSAVPDDCTLIALDELAAVVGDGDGWRVFGEGSVIVKRGERSWMFRPGNFFHVPSLLRRSGPSARSHSQVSGIGRSRCSIALLSPFVGCRPRSYSH